MTDPDEVPIAQPWWSYDGERHEPYVGIVPGERPGESAVDPL